MMKRLVSAAALSMILSGAALAQAPAPTTEAIAPNPTETGSITQHTDTAPQTAVGSQPSVAEAAPQASESAAVPDSVDACIANAVKLGSTAESKTLTPESAEHLDALFSKMETLCDGEQFAEAVTVEKDIRSIIEAN